MKKLNAERETQNIADTFTIAIEAPGSSNAEGYVYYTGFAKLSEGSFVALAGLNQSSVAIREGVRGHQGRLLLSKSEDGGATWRLLPTDFNFGRRMIGGALFVHEGALYMFVSPDGNDSVVSVARSEDEGETWSDFTEVIRIPRKFGADISNAEQRSTLDDDPGWSEGQKWIAYCQNTMAVQNGRLYIAVSELCQDMAFVTCDLTNGLMNPESWTISPTAPVSVPAELSAGLFPGASMGTLEGNVVEVNGQLRVIARQVVDRYGTSNIAAIFEVKEEDGKPSLAFTQFFPIPGAHGKFDIVYDEPSRLYWMATNLESNSQNVVTHPSGCHKGRDRRFLSLWYALDALNWFPAGFIACAERMEQTFNYPCMVVDGDDLAVLSRTTMDVEHYTSHDADLVTFHRVKDFRTLALNIFPVP